VKRFDLTRSQDGDRAVTDVSGSDLLRFPLTNKGTGFTPEERREFGLDGLLPSRYHSIEDQAARLYDSIKLHSDPVTKFIALAALQDRNETLFYKLMSMHLDEFMPIVYTPTVGKACQYYSRVYRRARGLFITPEHRGRIVDVLKNALPRRDIRLMVVTDNESILGIGDQGAGGMAISIGKLALYCAGAGIHPTHTLPVSLDVGTDNPELLEDPFYLGYRERRLRGDDYLSLVDEFVDACKVVFPKALIQWEDFRRENALAILDRYREKIPSFNDDIQGTGAVATACVGAAFRITGQKLSDARVLIFGGGAAGLGIARQLKSLFAEAGLRGEALARSIAVMDSRGVITDERKRLDALKDELAWPAEIARSLGLDADGLADLGAVAKAMNANVLIGTSGQGGAFNQSIVETMLGNTERPVILPLSNPTSIAEAVPSELYRWTDGRALVATGSPFDPIQTPEGLKRVGQANNVFVFPGIGLGAMAVGATTVSDSMVTASARAMANSLSDEDIANGSLVPDVSKLWDVSGEVAYYVGKQAIAEGNAVKQFNDDELRERVDSLRWKPRYPTIVTDTS